MKSVLPRGLSHRASPQALTDYSEFKSWAPLKKKKIQKKLGGLFSPDSGEFFTNSDHGFSGNYVHLGDGLSGWSHPSGLSELMLPHLEAEKLLCGTVPCRSCGLSLPVRPHLSALDSCP